MNPAVFLDRDGVINRTFVRDGRPFAPTRLDDFEFLPGVAGAVARLTAAGFRTVVVTNQPDVATGKSRRDVVDAMHARVREELGVDDVLACFHTDEDRCGCRKPQAGMLLAAAEKWNLSLGDSFMVGDRWRDIGAGRAAGCKTVFIDAGYDEPSAEDPDWTARDLTEAAAVILKHAPTRPAQGGASI